MGYLFSPEFHKQMWMSISPFKLVAPPLFALVLGSILYAAKGSGGHVEFFTEAGCLAFLAIVLLWGCQAAGGVVQAELTGCTWDIPRASRLTTGQLTFGMFLGAVAYPWYCASLLLLVGLGLLGMQVPHIAVYVVAVG